MSEEIEDAKIVTEENAVVIYVKNLPADEETKVKVLEAFGEFFNQAEEWEKKAKELVVTNADQVREMQMARTARLALADIRIEVEKRRKTLGEESLRKKQAIDQVAKIITSKIEPTEQYLKLQEKFAELEEQKKKDEIKNRRMQEMFAAEASAEGLDLANLPEEVYQGILTNAAKIKQNRIDAEQKAIEEEANRKQAELEEQERIRLENETMKADAEKLRKESEAKEAKIKEQQAILELERKKADELLEDQRKTSEQDRIKREKENEAELEKQKKEFEAKMQAEQETLRASAEAFAKDNERLQQEAIELTKKIRSDSNTPLPEEVVDTDTGEITIPEGPVVIFDGTDFDKIQAMKKTLFKIEYPEMMTEEGKKLMANVEILIQRTINFISQNEDKVPSQGTNE
jgi:hypothetical protein